MVYNEQELLPIEQIKSELHALCLAGESGDLRLFTEEKHAAVISLYEGKIVALRYRISRGNDALKLIKGISKAKITFKKNNLAVNQVALTNLPSTAVILKSLGVEVAGGAVQTSVKSSQKRIMVVEDSSTQRKVICRMISQNGYQAIEASDGYKALAKLNEIKPDLILLDIIMPGIDGYKVMALIKEKPGMKDIPIIMLTSRGKLIDKMRGKVSGTNEYLTKPFKYEELISKIDKYLYADDIHRGTPALA